MSELQHYLSEISIAGLVGLFLWFLSIKRSLKAELVDPDIERLDKDIKSLRIDFENKLAKAEENNQKMFEMLDSRFKELNAKMDKNSQAVSSMQGMLTVIFNGMKNNGQYE